MSGTVLYEDCDNEEFDFKLLLPYVGEAAQQLYFGASWLYRNLGAKWLFNTFVVDESPSYKTEVSQSEPSPSSPTRYQEDLAALSTYLSGAAKWTYNITKTAFEELTLSKEEANLLVEGTEREVIKKEMESSQTKTQASGESIFGSVLALFGKFAHDVRRSLRVSSDTERNTAENDFELTEPTTLSMN